jgi:hypothetical protein
MNILDRAQEIPVSECFTGDNDLFRRECIRVIDTAKSTSWGLVDQDKLIATLLRAWSDAASAAMSGVDEEEVQDLRNKLKGANMARGRLEKQVQTLKEHLAALQGENNESS